MLFLQMLTGHLVGDFYLQTKKTADKKAAKFAAVLLHSLVYAAAVTLFSMLFGNWRNWLVIFAACFVSHTVIDYIKCALLKPLGEKRGKGKPAPEKSDEKRGLFLYFADQILHAGVIFALAFISAEPNGVGMNIIGYLEGVFEAGFIKMQMMLAAFLAVLKPSSLLIDKILPDINKSETGSGGKNDIGTAETNPNSVINKKLMSEKISKTAESKDRDFAPKTGALIGYLERIVILILGLMKLYTVIGIVLTAKSLARFNQLNEKGFAEKYLVGTLASLALALFFLVLIENAALIARVFP